jgi:uncharacterized membrane protein YphA (DoxX/SURF4 family)
MAYLLLTRTVAWFLLLYTMVGALVVFSESAQPQPES